MSKLSFFIEEQIKSLEKELVNGKMGKTLSSELKYSARNNFKLSKEEEVLYVYSTSFLDRLDYNEITQGTVITDLAINIIVDNGKPNEIISLPWQNFVSCEYKDMTLYFQSKDVKEKPFEMHLSHIRKTERTLLESWDSLFIKKQEPNYDKIGTKIAKAFNTIIEQVNYCEKEDNVENEKLLNDIIKMEDEKDWGKLDAFIEERLNKNHWLYYILKAEILDNAKVFDKALQCCNKAIDIINADEDSKEFPDTIYLIRSSIYKNLEDYNLARKDMLMIKEKNNDEIREKFNEINELYNQHFYDIPYDERKIILLADKVNMNSDSFVILNTRNIPKNMILPLGHPKDGELYIGHPFIKNKYFPLENYELELLEDKIREFCELVESLGATEVYVESISSKEQVSNQVDDKSTSIEDNIITGIKADYKTQKNGDFKRNIERVINISQKFSPKNLPTLPQDLNWYNIEYSWQRLYNQRIRGSLTEHRERIETRKISLIQEKEFEDINAGIEIFADSNVKYNKLKNKKYHTNENVEIVMHVKFAPLDSLR